MARRYLTNFIAIIGLTVFWVLIILIYLPEPKEDITWHVKEQVTSEKNKSSQWRKIKPPRSQPFMKYFQQNSRDYTEADLLFHDFDVTADISQIRSSISQKKHEKISSQLAKPDTLIDKYVKSEGDRLFAFNLLASNRAGLYRAIPDTRHELCTTRYNKRPPTESEQKLSIPRGISKLINLKASIIICYYNEAPSALLRTIYTVLMRSPRQLIQEILIVDDFSGAQYQADIIRPYIHSDLVKVVRTKKREGLIRARLFGASLVEGDVLVFLDSHVEANVGWLEPLLEEVQSNRSTIACPIIDLINAETLIYTASPMVMGGLGWGLNFKWDSVPSDYLKKSSDFVKAIYSPTMAGGLFAINRKYFYELGSYDEGMDLWGGENVELSLRTWMCGGRIVILPCSRLGHIFRKRRPYGPEADKPDSFVYNTLRVARVWLDEYIDDFLDASPDAVGMDSGDISRRLELKKNLSCENFTWYLENIYPALLNEQPEPETEAPKPKLFKYKSNRVDRSADFESKSNLANTSDDRDLGLIEILSKERMDLAATNINRIKTGTVEVVTQFQIQVSGTNLCIESASGPITRRSNRLILNQCVNTSLIQNDINNYANSNQVWSETKLHDFRIGSSKCLDLVKNLPLLNKCHSMGSFQQWNHNTNASKIYIYNTYSGLCLAVERLLVNEPVIVTMCEKEFRQGSRHKFSRPSAGGFGWTNLRNQIRPGKAKRLDAPFQQWKLIPINKV